jgi:DNA-binding transcriptional LysR family regulator
MVAAALGGVALAQVPEPIVAGHLASGELEEVLSEHAPSSPGLFLYFPSRAQVMPKLRAFIDHVKAYAEAVLLNPPRKSARAKDVRRRARSNTA